MTMLVKLFTIKCPITSQKNLLINRFVCILKVVSMVTAGYRHSAAITDDGYLYTWGEGDYGRLGMCISVG